MLTNWNSIKTKFYCHPFEIYFLSRYTMLFDYILNLQCISIWAWFQYGADSYFKYVCIKILCVQYTVINLCYSTIKCHLLAYLLDLLWFIDGGFFLLFILIFFEWKLNWQICELLGYRHMTLLVQFITYSMVYVDVKVTSD